MATIYAELTAGGEDIVLVAGGMAESGIAGVADAAKQLRTLTPLFRVSKPAGALITAASWSTVVQLAATFGDRWAPGVRLTAWINEQTSSRVSSSGYPLDYTPQLPLVPYPWQTEGAQMIAATGRALITDEPGTGKTITSILGIVEHLYREDRGPVIVVCPASVIDPWVDAWRLWAPHVKAIAWRGTPKVRHALAGTADVYVTSYDTARTDTPKLDKPSALRNLSPGHLVIDECHLIKNPSAARSQSVRRIANIVASKGGAVVALSGTPITHNPGDLWSSLVCLMPDAWPSKERWVNRYCNVITGDYKDEILGLIPEREPEFRLTLLGQHRRVAKADVLTMLPPKTYSVRTVDMPPKWRKVYDTFEADMLAELPDGTELQVMDVMSQFGHLSRLASAAAEVTVEHGPDIDVRTGKPKRHVHLELQHPSWKVDALLEVLAERPGQPVVVFAPSKQLVKLAGEKATEAGLRVGYVVGGQTPTVRTATVNAFQAGQLDVICVTTSAGGVGITLTAAKTVVFLQRPWSIVESIQAEDRCHRIGSEIHDVIEVIDIVARNTIDTRIRDVLRERAGQLGDLVQDPRIVAELLGGTSIERKSA